MVFKVTISDIAVHFNTSVLQLYCSKKNKLNGGIHVIVSILVLQGNSFTFNKC